MVIPLIRTFSVPYAICWKLSCLTISGLFADVVWLDKQIWQRHPVLLRVHVSDEPAIMSMIDACRLSGIEDGITCALDIVSEPVVESWPSHWNIWIEPLDFAAKAPGVLRIVYVPQRAILPSS